MQRILGRVGRALAYTAAALITVVLLGVIYAFIVNSFDESLTPQAQALLAEPPHTVRSEGNLYVAIMGFQVPAGESPIAAGQRRIVHYNAALDGMLVDVGAQMAFSATDMPRRLEFNGDSKLWSPLTGSLWESAKTRRTELQQAKSANAVLLERYRLLHTLQAYDETARPSYLMPIGTVPAAVRGLYLADIAARFQAAPRGQRHQALQDLAADVALWRTVLTSKRSLLSVMLAAGALRADELLLADLIADPSTDLNGFDNELKALLQPFSAPDWRLGEVFAAEYRATDAMFRPEVLDRVPMDATSARPVRWIRRHWNSFRMHFFKLHATENLRAEQINHNIALSAVDLDHYAAQLARYRDWASRDESVHGLAALYNPVGRLLTSIARGAYGDYQTRVFDAAALQRLPICELEIRRRHLAAGDVPAFLSHHPEWCSHVVPGHPFHWDPSTRQLSVVPLSTRNPTHRWSVALKFL